MEPIENIRRRPGHGGLCMFIGPVLETSGVGPIRHERTETRDKGHIRKCSPCSARLVQTRRFALRAFVKVSVQTSIAYTQVDATCKFHELEAGERPDMGSCLGEILHACLGKDAGHFIKGRGG